MTSSPFSAIDQLLRCLLAFFFVAMRAPLFG